MKSERSSTVETIKWGVQILNVKYEKTDLQEVVESSVLVLDWIFYCKHEPLCSIQSMCLLCLPIQTLVSNSVTSNSPIEMNFCWGVGKFSIWLSQ
jgi:hypothetical protein